MTDLASSSPLGDVSPSLSVAEGSSLGGPSHAGTVSTAVSAARGDNGTGMGPPLAKSADRRNKAKRIRKKGDAATPEERAWYAEYLATKKAPGRPPKTSATSNGFGNAPTVRPIEAKSVTPSTSVESPSKGPSVIVSGGAVPPGPDAPVAIAPAATHSPTSTGCGNPNCTGCALNVVRCPVSGAEIRPRISLEMAADLAGTALGAMCFGITKGTGVKVPLPSEEEKKHAAPAVQQLVWQRAGGLEQWMDLIMISSVLISFGQSRLAVAAEEIQKKKAAEKRTSMPQELDGFGGGAS